MNKVVIILLSFLLLSWTGNAQLVTQVQNPVDLVNNVLLGDNGITVSNITYQGAAQAIGSFTAANTNLGLSSGIVMTTGTVLNNGNGPHGPNDAPDKGFDNGSGGYPLLTSIVNKQTFNATVLSFDFQTCSDSIEFRYVFGSEEYPEYVGSQFNDVFGFFISGPGFNGQQNIARLPNGSVVAINSVNNGNNQPAAGVNPTPATNPQHFVWNGNGNQQPYNLSNLFIQYDGFTKVLTAKARVQCNATYRLTLAVADVGDPIYDSGIFLEAKSFKASDPLKVTYSLSNQLFEAPNIMSEPCTEATIRFERTSCNLNTPINVQVVRSGSATNGVDYTNIPSTLTLPAGQAVYEFKFNTIFDALAEGDETLGLEFRYVDNCGEERTKNLNFVIRDLAPTTLNLTANEMICPGDNVTIRTNTESGTSTLRYLWDTGATTPTITVSPNQTTTYNVIVRDECDNVLATGTYTVEYPDILPLEAFAPDDITEICPFIPHTLQANAGGGSGYFTYSWQNAAGQTIGTGETLNISIEETTFIVLTVVDACGEVARDTMRYTVTSPKLIVTLDDSPEICPGESIELTANVTGGYGQYYYLWPHSGETTRSVTVAPWATTTYEVIVSDECQTFTVSERTRVVVVKPTAKFEIVSAFPLFNNLPVQFENQTINGDTYLWSFGNGQTSTDVHPQVTYTEPGSYTIELIAWDAKGCVDTTFQWTIIVEEHYIYIPNTFTPDGGRFNETFKVSGYNLSTLEITIYNRWGQLIFSSDKLNFEWDGTHDGELVPDGTYTYKVKYTARSGYYETLTGHINVLR